MNRKPIKLTAFSHILLLVMSLSLGAVQTPEIPEVPDASLPTGSSDSYKVIIASDTHFFPDSLNDHGEIFKRFEAEGDGKMLTYNVQINEAFVNDVIIEAPDAVIITGDLTLNGEKQGHIELAQLLGRIVDAGIKVLVIPGNHDINNPFARKIADNQMHLTDYVTPDEFKDIYRRFGYEGAEYYEDYSFSYIMRLNDDLYAIMLDSCLYEDNIEENRSQSSGLIFRDTIEWIADAVNEIKITNKNAKFIMGLHHNLFVHNSNFTLGYQALNAQRAVERFSELGIQIVFSGHIHIQHILSDEASGITEILNGSLITYRAGYGVAEFDEAGMRYYTKDIDMARYAAQNGLANEDFMNFLEYSKSEFNERAARRTPERLAGQGFTDEEIAMAAATTKLMNTYYFAGRLDEIADEVKASEGYRILMQGATAYLASLFEEGAGEHNKIEIEWR